VPEAIALKTRINVPPPDSAAPNVAHDETFIKVMRALVESMGISLGKAIYCLKALLDKGLTKVRNFGNSQNKLAYAYFLTPKGAAARARLTGWFLRRKVAEHAALRREMEELKTQYRESLE